jgi:hypothetical protein
VSWVRRACLVRFDERQGPLLLDFQTRPAGRQPLRLLACFIACLGIAALFATSYAPIPTDAYFEGILFLSPAALLGALFLEFGLRPHETGSAVTARPWPALESFGASGTMDQHVHPENELDEALITAFFYRSIPSMEVLRGIFNRQAMIEFNRALIWEFLERRPDVLAALEESMRPASHPGPSQPGPGATQRRRPGRL